jgi:hypothetical protein
VIKNNNRLIIVLGMAHSGTTIFTKTLLQCPNVICLRNGPQRWIFENTYIRKRKTKPIEQFLCEHPHSLVVMKKPWAETHYEFFREKMPEAYFVCMLKSFKAIRRSWSKKTSFVSAGLRNGSEAAQKRHYDKYYNAAMNFPRETGAKRYFKLSYQKLLKNPNETFVKVNRFLDLNFKFDTSEIKPGGNVKKTLL